MSNLNRQFVRVTCILSAALITTCLSQRAHAEKKDNVVTTTHGDDYGYKFDDEALLGSTLANGGDIYAGRKRFQRVLLLRPRTDLRPEIYKSVENL